MFFICCHKVSNFLQIVISGWLKTSFKQQAYEPPPPTLEMKNLLLLPQNPKNFLPSTPNHCTPKHPYNHERNLPYPSPFLPPLTNAFFIEHIYFKLWIDASMMWHLHQVNWAWHKVVGEFVEWHALNLVKYHNTFYHYTIAAQKHPKQSLK